MENRTISPKSFSTNLFLTKSFSTKLFYSFIFLFVFFIQINPNKATPVFSDRLNINDDGCYLPAPQNARIEKVNSYSLTVKWDAVAGNAGYFVRIYEIVNNVLNPTPVQESDVQEPAKLFTNLASGRKYRIAIGAICPQSQGVTGRDGSNVTVIEGIVHDEILFSQHPTNPFSGQIKLTYEIAKSGMVNMGLYDVNGTEVVPVMKNEFKEQGTYQQDIKTEGVKPGLYFLNVRKEETIETLKLMKLN